MANLTVYIPDSLLREYNRAIRSQPDYQVERQGPSVLIQRAIRQAIAKKEKQS